MSKYGDMSLNEVVEAVTADSQIDTEEAQDLRDLFFADGVITEEEVEAMTQIHAKVGDSGNCAEYGKLYEDVLCSFVLEDETSPGEISKDEAEFLVQTISADGKLDAIERSALTRIKNEAKSIAEPLASYLATNL